MAVALGAVTGCAGRAPQGAAPTTSAPAAASAAYFPEPGDAWQRRRPADAGMDSAALASAVAFAQAHEINWSRDMAEQLRQNTAREPYPEILGPSRTAGRRTESSSGTDTSWPSGATRGAST